MSTARFDQLWQDAYARDLPLIREAARLAGLFPELADDRVALFRLAAELDAAGAAFEAAVVDADAQARTHRRRVAALLDYLDAEGDGPVLHTGTHSS